MKWSSGSCRPAVGRRVQTSAVGCARQSGAVGCARQSGAAAWRSGAAWRGGAEAWRGGGGGGALWSGRAFGCSSYRRGRLGVEGGIRGKANKQRQKSQGIFIFFFPCSIYSTLAVGKLPRPATKRMQPCKAHPRLNKRHNFVFLSFV